ncbi:imidazole glycerol phosphate synthase subunit HisH [Staphylococcus sp. 17KM0847]|uniref:imidazole glycerol phosphate synthase subunit HisH n=1 Tax=Staphylococcus sp. 17KM0847 TaxID=2583989 RepID=UPI0015DD16E6|nr:imidazole glycerol phosphate synthase subunit HisH [Staphylococcus sp. 17KM0847]QLK86847.1 imidazole glycerol phosphate synthase subunit HisH [Staphylococcus sp. 17KM0847]
MIVIIDYGLGNVHNVQRAIEHLGYQTQLSRDPNTINNADQLILPGVGHFQDAMKAIHAYGLDTLLKSYKKPIIGICLGMQLMYERSEEGHVEGLGLLKGNITEIQTPYSIPHLGWNNLLASKHDLTQDVYFVHSYQAPMNDYVIAHTDYGTPIPAIVQHHTYIGIQFHPEKSGQTGLNILNQALKGGWHND